MLKKQFIKRFLIIRNNIKQNIELNIENTRNITYVLNNYFKNTQPLNNQFKRIFLILIYIKKYIKKQKTQKQNFISKK